MDLAPPPTFEHLLFEDPYTLGVVLGVVALGLAWLGWHQGRGWAFKASPATALAAAGAALLAWSVETDREHIIARTRHAVELTAGDPLELERLRTLFAPDARLLRPDQSTWLNAEQLFERLEQVTQRWLIRGHSVTQLDAQINRETNTGLTLLDLRSMISTELGDQVIKTRWLLHWSPGFGGPWRVTDVRQLDHPDPNGLDPQHGMWPQ